jgi:hypothetical protein
MWKGGMLRGMFYIPWEKYGNYIRNVLYANIVLV